MSKVAVLLYGEYSDYYTYNDWNKYNHVDFYYTSFVNQVDENVKDKFKSGTHIELPLDFTKVHQLERQIQLQEYLKNTCNALLSETYDIYLYIRFNQILCTWPTESGTYHASYYSFQNIHYQNRLSTIEIISSTHVRVDGGKAMYIYLIPNDKRTQLFQTLFQNQVYEIHTIPTMHVPNTIFIPSVIHTSTERFDYVPYRSIFTPAERLRQTLKQLDSITDTYKDFYPIVLEGGHLDLHELRQMTAHPNVIVVLFCTDERGNHYANKHPNKSIYEIYVLKRMLSIIYSTMYIKFGGRYHLVPSFEMSTFQCTHPVCKVIEAPYTFGKHSIVECVMYSFPFKYRDDFIKGYGDMITSIENDSKSIETLLYKFMATIEDVEYIPTLHVYGRDAIEGFENLI